MTAVLRWTPNGLQLDDGSNAPGYLYVNSSGLVSVRGAVVDPTDIAPGSNGDVLTTVSGAVTWAPPSGGGGGTLTLSTVEVNLGSIPRRAGRFTIAGVGLTAGKPVSIQQASGPYTGKGSRADEAEMDQVLVAAKVISTTVIECFWRSVSWVKGNFKFNYVVSA